LRALESFARHGTVWQAADELALTRSAVSHQLRMLERDLDFRLFDRIGTRIELTAQGRAYATDIILTAGPVDSNVSCPDVVRLNHCPEGRRIRYDDSYHTNRP
jgi:DNA-binding MarR family transcriptional regulator